MQTFSSNMSHEEPLIYDVHTRIGEDGHSRIVFEHLFDVGKFHYYLLLKFNIKLLDYKENHAFVQVSDVVTETDRSNAIEDCIQLFWPFI